MSFAHVSKILCGSSCDLFMYTMTRFDQLTLIIGVHHVVPKPT